MGTPLSTPNESRRSPAITLATIGEWVDVAVAKLDKVPAYVYGTNEPAMRADGTPKTKLVLTCIVVQGTGQIKDGETRRVVQPGDLATIYIDGQDWYDPDLDKSRDKGAFKSWAGATTDLSPEVGDVVRWMYEADRPGKGAVPRKLRLFKIRRAKPEEAATTARCEELHRNGTPLVASTAGAPADDFGPF
jgi:hypothetical protein